MKLTAVDRIAVFLALVFLGLIALRPLITPEPARADSGSRYYVEPGITTIASPDRTRQVQGKIVIDLSTGNVWGFPTSPDVPYPYDAINPQAATSVPIYLGKFDLAATRRRD